MTRTQVDVLRHGEPQGGRLYRGGIDHPLSEKGWKQMWRAVDRGRCDDDAPESPWEIVVTSPLLRCAEFAQTLAQRDRVPLIAEMRFREVGFGGWEGKSGAEIDAADPEARTRFYRDPVRARPEGAEPLQAFVDRVTAAWTEVMTRYAGKKVLLVVHAGVVRAIIAQVLGAPLAGMYRIQVANASITRIIDDGVRPPTLRFHGRGTEA